MAKDRLVVVSYPADEEYARINSEVLAGDAEVAYTYELDDAHRTQTLRRADALIAWDLPREIPAGALDGAARLRFVQLLSAGVDVGDPRNAVYATGGRGAGADERYGSRERDAAAGDGHERQRSAGPPGRHGVPRTVDER